VPQKPSEQRKRVRPRFDALLGVPSRMPQRVAGRSGRSLWKSAGGAETLLAEFISAIAVWGGIGFGLDKLFGTWPILFVIGTLLGYVAGVGILMWRSKQTGGWTLRFRLRSPK